MSATKAVFVLIHGGWHNHSAWDRVTQDNHPHIGKQPIAIPVTTGHPVEDSHGHLCPILGGTERASAVGLDT